MEVESPQFARPHLCACTTHVDLAVNYTQLQQFPSFEALRERLEEELRVVYGTEESHPHVAAVRYSKSVSPLVYSSQVDETLFNAVRTLRENEEKEATLTVQLAEAEELSQSTAAALEVEGKRPTRKEREAARAATEALRTTKREMRECTAALERSRQLLANTFDIYAIRVYTKDEPTN